MNKICIDVVEILKSRIAVHDFGKPIRQYIEKCSENISAPTLFIVDLEKTNPLDYEFVNIAFRDLVLKYQSDSNCFVAFRVGKWEKEELFTGLLDILSLKKEKEKNEQEMLISHDHSFIIVQDGETEYVANLADSHREVLKLIEEHNGNGLESSEIQNKFLWNAEKTTKILQDLGKRKFIFHSDGENPVYYSIKNIINN